GVHGNSAGGFFTQDFCTLAPPQNVSRTYVIPPCITGTPSPTPTATATSTGTPSPTPTATATVPPPTPTPSPCVNYGFTVGTGAIVPGTVVYGNHNVYGSTFI